MKSCRWLSMSGLVLGSLVYTSCSAFFGTVYQSAGAAFDSSLWKESSGGVADFRTCQAVMDGLAYRQEPSRARSWGSAAITAGYVVDAGIWLYGLYYGLVAPNYGIAFLGFTGFGYATAIYGQAIIDNEQAAEGLRYTVRPEGTVRLVDGRCSKTGKPYYYRRHVFELDEEDMLSETSDKQAACLQKLSVQSSLDFCKYSRLASECRCTAFEEVTFEVGVE